MYKKEQQTAKIGFMYKSYLLKKKKRKMCQLEIESFHAKTITTDYQKVKRFYSNLSTGNSLVKRPNFHSLHRKY